MLSMCLLSHVSKTVIFDTQWFVIGGGRNVSKKAMFAASPTGLSRRGQGGDKFRHLTKISRRDLMEDRLMRRGVASFRMTECKQAEEVRLLYASANLRACLANIVDIARLGRA